MTYPNPRSGDEITAQLLRDMIPVNIYKPSTESVTNDPNVSDDSDLTIELEANAVYKVEFDIHYAAGGTGQFKTAWTTPSGSSGLKSCLGLTPSVVDATNPSGEMRSGVHLLSTIVNYGNRSGGNQAYAREEGVVATTTSGTLALQWAQNASNATATSVAGYSSMRVTRIG